MVFIDYYQANEKHPKTKNQILCFNEKLASYSNYNCRRPMILCHFNEILSHQYLLHSLFL